MPGALLTLLEHDTRERDRTAAALLRARAAAERARLQEEQLQQYRRDYQGRWSPQARGHSSVELLHSFRGFMQRLDDAVAQQQQQVQQLDTQCTRAQAALHACERRLASLRVLIERRHALALLQQRRSEQKELDEFALRRAAAQPANAALGGWPDEASTTFY